ncbi:MAG: hypothetical protein ACOYLQ_09385 [Hyphomicrobiaceae bacterium]
MATYAVLNGGQIVEWREIADFDNYPPHKKAANDEKGDGGPVLRPRVIEGEGAIEQVVIEPTRVRIIRTAPPAPEPPPPPTVAELIAYSAAKRWMVETGGIVSPVYGPIRTDERTQAVLTAGWAKATADAGYQITDWKTPTPGVYVTLPAAAIIAIANLVEAHVQACFTANKAVDLAIMADPPTITTTAEIDAAAWPSNT